MPDQDKPLRGFKLVRRGRYVANYTPIAFQGGWSNLCYAPSMLVERSKIHAAGPFAAFETEAQAEEYLLWDAPCTESLRLFEITYTPSKEHVLAWDDAEWRLPTPGILVDSFTLIPGTSRHVTYVGDRVVFTPTAGEERSTSA